MTARNQLMKEEARRLFDYRDGMLYWRHAASGRRKDRRAIIENKHPRYTNDKYRVRIGGTYFQAHYLIWNWHYGITPNAVELVDDISGIQIGNLREVKPPIGNAQYTNNKYRCHCCGHRVASPTPDIIAELANLPPIQEAVLRAVWAGKGRAVQPEAIFTAMYADDPDGGPGASKMYSAFKVALCHLRENLKGTGVSIANVGYRQGYKLVLKE